MQNIFLFILTMLVAGKALAFPFALPQVEYKEVKGFFLNSIEKRRDLGINYIVYRSNEKADYAKLWYVFGTLNEQQFNFLKETYGHGKSHVAFDPHKEYDLVDFLPPTMQAVMGHNFKVESGKVAANCWGSAYEVIRGAPELSVFWSDEASVLRFFLNDDYSEQIAAMSRSAEAPDLTDRLKPGDVFIYTDSSQKIAHAAIYIDENLFFEKVGTKGEYPYRLINGFGKNQHFSYQGYKVDIRRFGGEGKKPVPHPSEVLTYRNGPLGYRDYKLEMETVGDEAGRTFLPAYAYEDLSLTKNPLIPQLVRSFTNPVLNVCAAIWQGARGLRRAESAGAAP